MSQVRIIFTPEEYQIVREAAARKSIFIRSYAHGLVLEAARQALSNHDLDRIKAAFATRGVAATEVPADE